MNTKKALSLILLVSLLSQCNAFGMFKVSKLFKSVVRTPIFYNTTPSKIGLFTGFLTANRSKKQRYGTIRKPQRRKNNVYTELLTRTKQLRNRIKTDEKIVAAIKETNNKIGEELDDKFSNNLFFYMAIALFPTALFRVPVSYISGLFFRDEVKGSINTHMDDLERKLTASSKKKYKETS